MTRVFTRDLRFMANHGGAASAFVAEVSLLVDELAHETDRLADTVDFREIRAVVAAVALNDGYLTMERLARQLCQTLLMRFPTARRVDLVLTNAEGSGVEMFLERSR